MNLDKIKNALSGVNKQFKDKVVQIGLPSGINYEDGTSVAYVATIQEFGSPASGIPPRPFFTPTVKAQGKEWGDKIGKGVVQVRNGNLTADMVLEAVGRVAVSDLQATINSVSSPPLKPSTIAAKGFDKPLIDTGLMIASIQSKVATKGEDFTA